MVLYEIVLFGFISIVAVALVAWFCWIVSSFINYEVFGEDVAFYLLRRKYIYKDRVLISFESFINMSQIAPHNWDSGRYDYVVYSARIHQPYREDKRLYMKTFSDYLKLRQYRKNEKNDRLKEESCGELKLIIDSWKEDLKDFESNQ